MTPEEARAALAADEAERIEAFRADFAALEARHGVTVTVQVFITPDGRIDGQVVPVVVR